MPSLPLRLAPGGGLGGVSAAESVGSASVASSPAGTPFIALDQPLPVLPAVGKVDHATLVKRAIQLEENQRKVWISLARKDIPKVRPTHLHISEEINLRFSFRTGLQTPIRRLPNQTPADQKARAPPQHAREKAQCAHDLNDQAYPGQVQATHARDARILAKARSGGERSKEEGREGAGGSGKGRRGEAGGAEAGEEVGIFD